MTTHNMTEEQEWEAALRRAFVDRRADSIVLYDRRERFLLESAAYGERMGWLEGRLVELDEQSTEERYRLTSEGRKHFGLEAA